MEADKDVEEMHDVSKEEEYDSDVEVLVDVNSAMKKCKPPPNTLLVEDWIKIHGLEGTGENPKRWGTRLKNEEDMKKIFGLKRLQNGYKWKDTANPKVLARVKHLHPIIYQHDPKDMSCVLKIKFAEGIQHELVHGLGSVN